MPVEKGAVGLIKEAFPDITIGEMKELSSDERASLGNDIAKEYGYDKTDSGKFVKAV